MTYLRRHLTLDDAMDHVRRVVGSAGLAPGSRHNSWHGNGWTVRLTRTDLLRGTEHILVTVESGHGAM